MEDTAQCLILNHQLGNSPEQELTDKLKEIINEKNTQGFSPSAALNSQGYSNIQSICVGPQNIGVLLKDGGICRWATQSRIHHVQPPSQTPSQGNNSGGPNQAANRNNLPKFRRVMLSASSFDRFRRDGTHRLVLDRGRPMLPASSVPEDLISQAQVVLQGKSREVIVRELQRTNLNVNEAVNNLLSRDDDEDDEGEGGEVVLPEELLSLLDPSSGNHPILDTDLYGTDFEYVLGRDLARRRAEKEKDKKSKDNSGSATPTAKSRWELDDQTEWWSSTGRGTPDNVEKFVMMTATGSELLAVTDTGILYGWSWDQDIGDLVPHKVAQNLIPANDPIVQISSSRLRVVCLLKSGQICSWLDNYLLGDRVCSATEVKPVPLILNPEETVVQLIVSDHLGLAQTSQNAFHWIGLYPFSERPKLWEKEKNKSKKHVTFDTNSSEIKEGSEVRTKACPIYAPGSVAVNFQSHEPMIGILMESVWTLTEVVRFKLIRPAAFDKDFPSDVSEGPSKPIGESRKRRASTEIFENSPCKEEVWGVCDVIWIHEQQTQDVATVKIVDGAYVGVEYERGKSDMTYASSLSGSITSKDVGTTAQGTKIRLMRKDELILVTPKMKGTRSPRVFQKEPLRFAFSGASNRKVISAVAESTGIRALTEKRGRLYITRSSIDGKILSEHVLPVFPQSLYGQNGEPPSLENYGEDSLLILKDGNGAVHPLVRDSMMGFREPQALNLPQVRHFGFCIELLSPLGSGKTPTRKLTLAAVTGPRLDAALHEMPSLSQLVLFCDTNKLKYWLDVYSHCKDPTVIKQEILGERSDNGCNLLHMAIRLSIAHKNKDDADPGTTHGIRLREDEMKMARDEARDLDQRWQRLIRANRSGEPPREEPSVIQAAPIQDNAVQSPESPKEKSQDMPMIDNRSEGTVSDPKERQKKAIEIVSLILNHPTVAPFVFQLLIHRDYGGLTPFQAALNIRAYGAATAIWEIIKELCYPPPNSGREVFPLQKLIYPSGSRPDDNPLFLLCYNDTCSFTWTGDEHINQDIFECRTCGLTGSLCCCTECAYTCHRNHDCKLKRTSPTAYCDCWEKCPCKALIAGNQDKREALLKDLVTRTNLYFMVNNKGEHLMLFLAKTLGRQMSEQNHTNRRRRPQAGMNHSDPAAIPEHDLEPPKFAKFAMETCLEEWMVMKSLIEVGCRNVERMPSSTEDFLCLNSQNGSTHLDKFVFILVSKCGDTILTQVLDCMVKNSKVTGPEEDPNFHQNINRFVRSVLRIYVLLMLMSPNAAAVGIKGKNPNASSTQENRRVTAISVSGLFSIVRPSDHNSKEHKALLLTNIILRCREILLRLCPYAVEQAASLANTLLAPVRYGILRPSCNLQNLVHSNDPVEALEKFLNNEYDLTTLLLRIDDTKERSQRKRKSSKREAEPMEEDEPPRREDSEYSDDSEMDEAPSSRRHNSQSQAAEPPASGDNIRRKNAISVVFDEELTDPGSSSSDSEPSDEEPEGHVLVDDEIEDEDTEEDDHDERYGENSEGDQDHEENPPYDDPDNDEQRNENDYASPSYDSRDVPAGDREIDLDEDDRRDGPVPDGQPEDEDNTRDAVHSEASSTDAPTDEIRNEMASDSVPRPQPVNATITIPTEMQRDPPRDPRRDGARRIPQRYPMSWTTRRTGFLESENDTDERRESHRDSARETTTRAPPSSQNNTGTAASPAETNRKTNTDNVPSIQQTSQQLSLAFAFAIRTCCDLLAAFHASQEAERDDTLNWNDDIYQAIVNRIVTTMQGAWDWMFVVLDRMEAQLRFGNAIMLSDAADVKTKPQKRKDKKDKGDEAPPTNTRKEAMEYLMATMRGQESEAGDDYPLVDVDTLRSLVFIFDGYLGYQETLSRTYFPSKPKVPEAAKRKQTMHKFFQRSNSLCFPGSALTEAWDTMSRTMGKVPLAEKQHLLTPEAEQTTLFAPSPSTMTWREYTDLSRMNGISHVMNMNLATLESGVKAYGSSMFLPNQAYEDNNTMETDQEPPEGMEKFTVDEVRAELRQVNNTPVNMAMARWKNVVQFISKECHSELLQSYGGELSSEHLLSAVAKFPVRQAMFRRLMDKFRGQQTKDIAFEIHREPLQLIRDAVYQLNQTYVRRLNTPKSRDESQAYSTPLGSARVKVRFHDEPGEGTGVARSFYTALAEALQTTKKFPFENLGWEGTEDYLFGNQTISFPTPNQSAGRDRGTLSRIQVIRDRASASAILSRKRPTKRTQLSADSEPYVPEDVPGAEQRFAMGSYKSERVSEQITRQRPPIAEAIYVKVRQTRPAAAARIAGMLVDIPVSITMHCLSSPDLFKQYVEDAIALLLKVGKPTDLALLSEQHNRTVESTPHANDDAPLFARTHKRGLFAPVTGKMSPMRINAFKNVGRIMGLCLSQGELFPLKLSRHVLKFILNRPLRWLDLQFYDPVLWESLRQMLTPDANDAFFHQMEMTFTTDVTVEETDGVLKLVTVPLKEGGENILVTRDNIVEYVYKVVELKLLGPDNMQIYSAMRQGITDVIPIESLDGLSAEDLRLLLCGTDSICISSLQAVTTFSDESHAAAETLEKFKQWFWAVVEGLTPMEKQELIFFWTGAPSLPTSPEALQPQPTVMVRPPDDIFLPTANTCISRLYVPLYSSKKLLRAKLQLAIKAKNFGFV